MVTTSNIAGADLATRLTREALNILGGISVRWNITDDSAARLASLSLMGYLRRRNGYESKPLPQEVVHRITALGLIDRALHRGGTDAAYWANASIEDEPFHGRPPLEVLPELDLEALTALNVQIGARRHQPLDYALPRF